jgi:hypothetical protein
VLAALPLAAPADTTGSISGYVRDEITGAPIAGVKVFARSPGQVAQAMTGPDGFYVLMDIEPGRYVVHTYIDSYPPGVNVSQVSAGEQTVARFTLIRALVDYVGGARPPV